ncbi:hypothetical protein JRQ81_013783 [Phrynocephalus forsythii]|uniref:Uncharacterized protein n=1 Tax=Phrynocephalus forsythii TaxID=171643 RepID=A0A9Q0Y0I5_9SAUR|nr:hypothetical protein JRQ81_013783 [Phrynocephalus forsythii]
MVSCMAYVAPKRCNIQKTLVTPVCSTYVATGFCGIWKTTLFGVVIPRTLTTNEDREWANRESGRNPRPKQLT